MSDVSSDPLNPAIEIPATRPQEGQEVAAAAEPTAANNVVEEATEPGTRPPVAEETALLIREPRVVTFQTYLPRPLGPEEVRVGTLYSGISAGTELTIYRGSNPYAHKRWDSRLRLFVPVEETPQFYPRPLGYEEVGCVVEVGRRVKSVEVGDFIYGSWGHRTEAVLSKTTVARNRFQHDQDPRHGLFARIGAIVMNGILDAQIHVGETVAVFGAGVVGLIAMALARLSGAYVYGVDINPQRLQAARLYADQVVGEDAARKIKEWTDHHRGADVVIEASGNDRALNEAIRTAAYAGKVIALGFYQGGAGGLYLGEEFHHNRVQVICSQISKVNPEFSARWDVPRLERTIMDLQASGRLNLLPLITHEVPFPEAAQAYQLLDQHPEAAVQVALTFPEAIAEATGGRSSES
jgi:2-desacetyl-2-hydroxyethyl bacteriochlorophyllide A dehydrogenase